MMSTTTRERITTLIWPALLLAMMVALAVVTDGSSCPSKRQIDGCGDAGCSTNVDLWSGLRHFFAPPGAPPTVPGSPERPAPTVAPRAAVFAAAPSFLKLTVLTVAPKTSPPA